MFGRPVHSSSHASSILSGRLGGVEKMQTPVKMKPTEKKKKKKKKKRKETSSESSSSSKEEVS